MTSHVGRLYASAIALLVLFLSWAAIAAHPWASSARSDPRLAALTLREQRVRAKSIAVQKVVQRRWALSRLQLARHRSLASATATGPAVRVVTLPPLTITRTS